MLHKCHLVKYHKIDGVIYGKSIACNQNQGSIIASGSELTFSEMRLQVRQERASGSFDPARYCKKCILSYNEILEAIKIKKFGKEVA
jgi:hypothetical protein